MMQEQFCPACTKRKRSTRLELKQINFENAVYLCPLKKCKYPKGYPWLVVKRSFDQLIQISKQKHVEKSRDNFISNTLNLSGTAKLNTESCVSDSSAFSNILNDLNNIVVDKRVDIDETKPKVEPDIVLVHKTEINEALLTPINKNKQEPEHKVQLDDVNICTDLLSASFVSDISEQVVAHFDDDISDVDITTDWEKLLDALPLTNNESDFTNSSHTKVEMENFETLENGVLTQNIETSTALAGQDEDGIENMLIDESLLPF